MRNDRSENYFIILYIHLQMKITVKAQKKMAVTFVNVVEILKQFVHYSFK